MGAVTSRPVVHSVETGLLAVAQLVDTFVRAFDRLLSAVIAKLFSHSLYAHFNVNPPNSAEAAVDVGPDGLTRVCTNDGVCYVPATRVHQHRMWRKRTQEDQLKQRKMRAEWAAAGLDVREMTKMEAEKRRKSKQQLSRTTTNEDDANKDTEHEAKRRGSTSVDGVEKEKPLVVMGNIAPREKNVASKPEQPLRIPKHSVRTLTAVREASHDHGAVVPWDLVVDRTTGKTNDDSARESKKHARRLSAPSTGGLMNRIRRKSTASVDATSASRIVPTATYPESKPDARVVSTSTLSSSSSSSPQMGHRPTLSLPINMLNTSANQIVNSSAVQPAYARSSVVATPTTPSSPLTAGVTLVQPKPRRPMRMSFDVNGAPFASAADLTPNGVRSSATPPPPAIFRPRTRNSIDISPAGTPFTGDDASSIRSKRSAHGIVGSRSTTPSTPPPYVVQLADRACKSRWESSAKERKGWKGEVKRLALNKVHEQHHAYRASLMTSSPNAADAPSLPVPDVVGRR